MTVWYAQAAGAIQSIEWDTVPTGGGTDLTWPPAADDVLCANGKAITWAAASVPTLTCARLSTTGEGTGTAGGGFTLSGSTAVTITADITAGTTTCVYSNHTGTGVNGVTINGNVTGGSVLEAMGAQNNGAGTLTINGNVTGGSAGNTRGVRNLAAGTLNITGAVTGGSGQYAHGAYNYGTGTINIYTGPVTGGSAANANGAWNQSTGTLTINGNVTGGSGANAYGARNNGAGTITIYTGPVTAGSGQYAHGAWNQSTGTITINGNVTAGSAAYAFGAQNNSTGAFTVIGSLVDTEYCSATTGAIYWQPVAGVHYHKVFRSAGAARYYSPSPADSDVRFGTFAGFSPSGVSYSGILALPAVANVRDGVFYDAYGTQEGTLALPAEADVKTGVGYGAGGEEFTGTLAAGGGGVPLIGPGGLVG